MGIEGFQLCRLTDLKLSENCPCVFELSSVFIDELFRGEHVFIEGFKDFFDGPSEVEFDVFEFAD